MIHTEPEYRATCAPGIISVAIPAATRGRLASKNIDLRQQVLITVDDNVRLVGEDDQSKKKEILCSEVTRAILASHDIPFEVVPNFAFGHFLSKNRQAVNADGQKDILDILTGLVRSMAGEQFVGFLVPIDRAQEAIMHLTASSDTLKAFRLSHMDALTYRGSERSMFGGPQCSIGAESVLLPKRLSEPALEDLANLKQYRSEHQERQHGAG